MDLWGTPYSIFDHVLKDEFILTLCSRSTKQLQIKFKEPLSKPYPWSFAINKSCIQMLLIDQLAEHHNDHLDLKILQFSIMYKRQI